MFHKHKYGKIEENGYQYCTKCGEATHEHKYGKVDKRGY